MCDYTIYFNDTLKSPQSSFMYEMGAWHINENLSFKWMFNSFANNTHLLLSFMLQVAKTVSHTFFIFLFTFFMCVHKVICWILYYSIRIMLISD